MWVLSKDKSGGFDEELGCGFEQGVKGGAMFRGWPLCVFQPGGGFNIRA